MLRVCRLFQYLYYGNEVKLVRIPNFFWIRETQTLPCGFENAPRAILYISMLMDRLFLACGNAVYLNFLDEDVCPKPELFAKKRCRVHLSFQAGKYSNKITLAQLSIAPGPGWLVFMAGFLTRFRLKYGNKGR